MDTSAVTNYKVEFCSFLFVFCMVSPLPKISLTEQYFGNIWRLSQLCSLIIYEFKMASRHVV